MHGVNHLARRPTGRLFHCKLHTILTLLQKEIQYFKNITFACTIRFLYCITYFKDYYIYG